MCSNRCAKPVRPARSFFEPTWYQSSACTIGVEWSSRNTTCRPFASVVIVYSSFGGRTAAFARGIDGEQRGDGQAAQPIASGQWKAWNSIMAERL